jgi:hypothetical protein
LFVAAGRLARDAEVTIDLNGRRVLAKESSFSRPDEDAEYPACCIGVRRRDRE